MACGCTPASISSPAIAWARTPVFSYMNRPVSVIRATYRASAICRVGATPRPCIRSHTISAVQEASGSTRFTVPNIVLSWWWSRLIVRIPGCRNALAALRSRLPQSRNTTVRSSRSSGGALSSPSVARNSYSRGRGSSRSSMKGRQSLPSAWSTIVMATSEPRASPSGFSCVTAISFSAERSSSSTCSRVERRPFSGIGLRRGVQQRRDAHASVDRLVVLKRQGGRALERQLGRDPALEEAVSRAQPVQGGRAHRLLAEHADVYPGMAQVWAGLYSGHGHKSDARVLQILRDGLTEHSSHRLIDATHTPAGHP